MKKIVSAVLVVSQMNFAMAAVSIPSSPTVTATPEFTLVQSVITLQGEKLTNQQLQTQFSSAITQYEATAPADGQQERFQQALVDIGLYTPAQAAQFAADAQAVAAKGGTSDEISQEVSQLAKSQPAGAQFSACDVLGYGPLISIGLVVAGLTALGIGYNSAETNPTCSAPVIGTSYDSDDNVVDVYGPTTCTKPNYYPYKNNSTLQAGEWMLIASLVLTVAGFAACSG